MSPPEAGLPATAPARVLLVDDSLPVRQRLSSLIDESGIGRVVAESATVKDALAAFEECMPDALVLDLQLHDGTGYTVLEQVKRRRPECRVIVVTNFATPEVRERCKLMSADECLEKSNDFERLPLLLVASGSAANAGVAAGRAASDTVARAPPQVRRPDAQLQLTDSLAAAIYTCDAEGRINYFNAAAVALWGREPVLGHERWCGWWRLLDTEGRTLAPEQSPMAQAVRERRPLRDCEIEIERPDGSRRQVLAYPQPLFAADGALTGAINLLLDITPLRALQAERQQEQALAQATLDSLNSHVCVIDASGFIVSVNRAWREFGETNGGDASRANIGVNYLSVCAQGVTAGAAQAAEFTAGLQGVLRGQLHEFETEYPCDGPNNPRWFNVRVTRLAGSGPSRVTIIHTDITQRKQAEAARDLLEAQLRESQKMEAVGTLAGSIAHDFNNVMGAILGNAALALQDIAADHPVAASLAQIQKAGRRARSLVQKILSFSGRQAQAMQVQLLRPLVEEGIDLLRATLPSGVTLRSALCDVPLAACLDATQLHQILMNLGTNAWHALRGQPGTIEIGMEACSRPLARTPGVAGQQAQAPDKPWIHLWVRDSGCGMDDVTRASMFEPFFTTKPSGIGIGLGLSIVRSIVQAHGGDMSVETAPGRGSCFSLYLPGRDLDASTTRALRADTTPAPPLTGQWPTRAVPG